MRAGRAGRKEQVAADHAHAPHERRFAVFVDAGMRGGVFFNERLELLGDTGDVVGRVSHARTAC